jgi:hypothetical protein
MTEEFRFADVGLAGTWAARDARRQKDLGEFTGTITPPIRDHGVVVLRLFRK